MTKFELEISLVSETGKTRITRKISLNNDISASRTQKDIRYTKAVLDKILEFV